MKIKLLFLLLFTALLSFAQNPADVVQTFEIHPEFSSTINATVTQPDGKIIVGHGGVAAVASRPVEAD